MLTCFFAKFEKPISICYGENLMATLLNYRLPAKLKTPSGVKQKMDYHLKVCIGTDSQVKGAETEFATVIVFLREGHGGFMFIHNEKTKTRYSIKERMLVEVAKSIEIAYELCPLFTLV